MSNDVFPLLFPAHVIFVIIGVGYFLFRFIRYKRPYQILLGLCILLTMVIRFLPNMQDKNLAKSLYNISMYIEFALLIIGFVWAIFDSIKARKRRKAEKSSEVSEITEKGGGNNT